MPVEWEGLPAMAVEVELDVEEASRTVNDPDVLTFLMDEAVQTFNSKGQHSWVGCKYLYLMKKSFCRCLNRRWKCLELKALGSWQGRSCVKRATPSTRALSKRALSS